MATSNEHLLHARNKLRHFLASVEDLEKLQNTMPLAGIGPDLPGDSSEYHWRVVLYATLLRKYFGGNDEKLRLDRVLNAVSVADDELTRTSTLKILDIQDVATFGIEQSSQTYGEGEILQLALYGRYLHGDFEKWEAVRPLRGMELVALQFAISAQLARLASVEKLVRRRMDEGHLTLE